MPPELCGSGYNATEPILATKVDIYEAGLTFGYLWSGVPPWMDMRLKFGSDFDLLYERITRGDRPSLVGGPRTVERGVINIIDSMIKQIPDDRPTFGEVRDMFELLGR